MLCLFCSHVIILWDLVDFLEKMHPTVTFSVFGNYIFGCHGWPQCSDVGTSGGILICSSEIKHELRSSRLETFSNCPGCSSRFWVLEIRYFFPAPEQFLCSPSKSNPHPLQKKQTIGNNNFNKCIIFSLRTSEMDFHSKLMRRSYLLWESASTWSAAVLLGNRLLPS